MIKIQLLQNTDWVNLSEMMFQLTLHYDNLAGKLQPMTQQVVDSRYIVKAKQLISAKQVWGYFQNNKICGYISIDFFDEHHLKLPSSVFLSELFVQEECRKRGVGRSLVRHVCSLQFPSNYKYFSVTHSPLEPGLTQFYKSLGFKVYKVLKSGNIALIKPLHADLENFPTN